MTIHEKSVASIEEARIFRLSPSVVTMGLYSMVSQRVELFRSQAEGDIKSEEEEWIIANFDAVLSFIAPDNSRIYIGEGAYHSVVRRTMQYMRFIGFSGSELTAQKIEAAKESEDVELGIRGKHWESETGMVDLSSRRLSVLLQRIVDDPANTETQRQESEKVRGETIEQYKKANLDEESIGILDILDRLMENFERLPIYEEFLAWAAKEKIEFSHLY